MGLGVRGKLVLLATLVVLIASFGFTWLSITLTRQAIEEDLRTRAILFAREIAATIGDRRELESGQTLVEQISRIKAVRTSVLQLDVLVFDPDTATVVATSAPAVRLPFRRSDAEQVRKGRVVSRAITTAEDRYWEVMAPITLDGTVAGAVAVKFSVFRGEQLAGRIRTWSLALSAASVVVAGVLMSLAIRLVVDRPIRQFMGAIAATTESGQPSPVRVVTRDEFGTLAVHFNEMVTRIQQFSDELHTRIREATGELDRRYREVERLNALLFEMQRRLGHAERLALSGRLMAEVAHEIGTPLHSVAGHLELLRRDLPTSSQAGDATRRLTIIETQVARVIEIIARLLDVTRRAPSEAGRVDVDRLARETADLVRPGLVRAGLTLEVSTEGSLPSVWGHHEQIQQVILNLLTNAIDATRSGGRIELTTRSLRDHAVVEIAVADTGAGIPADDQPHVFEAFFSTKGPGRGTGLGLFITSEIVREHGGRIELESHEGQGTTFRVTLPASEEAA